MLKYLRIAVTALSLTACVLLIALWVRSYWWIDSVEVTYGRWYYVGSWHGVISLGTLDADTYDESGWELESTPEPPHPLPARFVLPQPWGFEYLGGISCDANVPHWFLLTLSALSGIAPWIHWSRRFSIRTLLIATTLVALTLGIVAMSR